jgi:hypothetical protein
MLSETNFFFFCLKLIGGCFNHRQTDDTIKLKLCQVIKDLPSARCGTKSLMVTGWVIEGGEGLPVFVQPVLEGVD